MKQTYAVPQRDRLLVSSPPRPLRFLRVLCDKRKNPMTIDIRRVLIPLLFLHVGGCAQRQTTVVTNESAADTVRVLVYNMHAGKDAGGVDNLQRIVDFIREARADF